MKYNRRHGARGPIASTSATTTTHEGAIGHVRDARSELFLTAVSDFAEHTFYESADTRESRVTALVGEIARTDPDWIEGLVRWLRQSANLRSVPVMISATAVKVRLDAGLVGNRSLVSAALSRPDEVGEYLGYWSSRFGRSIPKPVKRTIADYLNSLTEYGWLKYRGKGGGYSLADAIALTHPKPKDAHQQVLFRAIIDEAYGRPAFTEGLPMVAARREFLGLDKEAQESLLADPEIGSDVIRNAGLTHEVIGGALGKFGPEVWQHLVPAMGYQALLMNLRRISESGDLAPELIELINRRLADPEQVRKSRMLPIRFLSAFRNAPLTWAPALQEAANLTLENVPALPGRTLVLVDCSGSMAQAMSQRSQLTRADAANLFGAALALRAEQATLVRYGSQSTEIKFRKGGDLLRLGAANHSMGGTATHAAVARNYAGHDRVILLTDEQASGYLGGGRGSVFAPVPAGVPCFTWSLVGYRSGHASEGEKRWTLGGLSDRGFEILAALDRGRDRGWPWEN